MREVDRRALVKGLGASADPSILGHENVEDDLLVTRPVPAVSEDEDSLDIDLAEVPIARVSIFLFRQLAERGGILIRLDDVSRRDDILEAVAFRDDAALLTLATDDEDSVVFLSHFSHGRVSADELPWRDFQLQLTAEVETALLFGLPTAIGDENIWSKKQEISTGSSSLPNSYPPIHGSLHFDSERVVAIQHLHGFDRLGDGLASTDEDAIDIKREGILIRDGGCGGPGADRSDHR